MTEQSSTPYRELRRPRNGRMVGGVAAGLARYADIDPTIVRIGFAALALITWGWALLAYPVLWLIMPEDRA